MPEHATEIDNLSKNHSQRSLICRRNRTAGRGRRLPDDGVLEVKGQVTVRCEEQLEHGSWSAASRYRACWRYAIDRFPDSSSGKRPSSQSIENHLIAFMLATNESPWCRCDTHRS